RNGHDVTMAGRDGDLLAQLEASRENLHYLPGFVLPEGVTFRNTAGEVPETDLLVVAVPSYAVESILSWVNGSPVTVIGSKGLEPKGTGLLT
ncbi:hypothetical protein ABTN69_19365, partial [Acinetobacter baumannii]